MKNKLLVINLGSSSTKLAIYQNEIKLWQDNIEHDLKEIEKYDMPYDQLEMRTRIVKETMHKHHDLEEELLAVVTRGGFLPPCKARAYEIDEKMIDILKYKTMEQHISNVACAVGYNIAHPLGIKAYIYDPITVDEILEVAKITGLKEIRRFGRCHNLNIRATALRYCKENNLDYYHSNIIVAHMGGGDSFALISDGRILDIVSDDEEAFSPERIGGMPAFKVIKYIFDHNLNFKEAIRTFQTKAGLNSLLGTKDTKEIEKMINEGNEEAKLVYEAMAYGVAKSIAKLSVVVDGKIDVIILTGGVAYSKLYTDMVTKRVSFIAPVKILPGENEIQALAEGAYRIINGLEEASPFVF